MVDASASQGAKKYKQDVAIGFDAGTSNSLPYVKKGGQEPRCVLIGSDRTTPSVVAFGSEPQPFIGKRAISQSKKKFPPTTVWVPKYVIGKQCSKLSEEERKQLISLCGCDIDFTHADDTPRFKVMHQGKMELMRPEKVCAYYLSYMKEAVINEMNLPKDANIEAVISVPARFLNAERNATKDAGRIAGIDVIRVIPEPTAAILSATHLKILKSPTGSDSLRVMVFDLGGGTFDVSVAQVHPDNLVEILGTDGDVMLGGSDFTKAVAEQLAGFFCEMYSDYKPADLTNDPSVMRKLVANAEEAKIAVNLQNVDRTEISMAIYDNEFEFDYTLKMFNTAFKPFAETIKRIINRLLNKLSLSISQFDSILLVGGSSRIKFITDILHEIGASDRQINRELNYDEAVAMGACLQAFNAGDYGGKEDTVLLLDVVPANINIRTNEDTATNMISEGTPMPAQKTEVFSTGADNQDGVTIHVSEGPYSVASKNTFIGQFHLTGIEKARRGVPQIEVTFNVDVDGILHVKAKDKKTGVNHEIKIEDNRMTPEQVKQAQEDYKANKDEDQRIGQLLKLKSQIMGMIMDLEEKISTAKDHPKFGTASAFLSTLKGEMMNYTTSNIAQKDEAFFMDKLNGLQSEKDLQEVIAAAGQDAAGSAPGVPAAPGPNVEEAD